MVKKAVISSRYTYLDGIRGIASILVCVRHTDNLWNLHLFRSYLSVDVFFMLSGFVVANRYDGELIQNRLSASDFIVARIVRLYPAFLLSCLLCSAIQFISNASHLTQNHSNLFLTTIATLLTFVLVPIPGTGEVAYLFPLNSVFWSLFYELVCNVLYALIHPLLRTKILMLLVLTGAFAVSCVAYVTGDLSAGSTWDTASLCAGISRSIFGIFCGLLLFRIRHVIMRRLRLGSAAVWLCALVVLLSSPDVGRWNSIFDVVAITVIIPCAILALSSASASKCDYLFLILGAASYPLYVLHIPLSGLLGHFSHGAMAKYAPWTGLLFLLIMITISKFVCDHWEMPVRKKLVVLAARIWPHNSKLRRVTTGCSIVTVIDRT